MYVIVEYPVRYPLAKRFGESRPSDKEGGGHPEIGGVSKKLFGPSGLSLV